MKTYKELEVSGNNNNDLLKGEKEMKLGMKPQNNINGSLDQYNLGCLYLYGRKGYPVDYDMAVDLLVNSANQGNLAAAAELEWLTIRFDESEEEKNKAFIRMMYIAEESEPNAIHKLSACYYHGFGTNVDKAKSLEYLEKAAMLNFPRALDDLSHLYYNGDDVTQDIDLAIYYCKQAAELGEPLSQYNLGLAYSQGIGVKQDHIKAIQWLRFSRHNGCKEADDYIRQVYSVYVDEKTNIMYINS